MIGKELIGSLVIVRCVGAGVHIGTLVKRSGRVVQLKDSRILWRWRGANTLHEVANKGVDYEYTRLSEPADAVLLDACEIIPVKEAARDILTTSRWGS